LQSMQETVSSLPSPSQNKGPPSGEISGTEIRKTSTSRPETDSTEKQVTGNDYTTPNGIFDARKVLEASSLIKQKDTVDVNADLTSNEIFDLGNLTLLNFENPSIENLQQTATKLTQKLIARLFALPAERAEGGPIVQLPPAVTPIPRAKPPPVPKPETKWEKFRKEKGIAKRKKSRLVWDPTTQTWKPRWGFGRINQADIDNPNEEKWVRDAKPTDQPGTDPWTEELRERKERVAKQKKNEMRNRKRALKAEVDMAHPILTTPQLSDRQLADRVKETQRVQQKKLLERHIRVAQHSTASLGRFDERLRNEPKLRNKTVVEPLVNSDEKTKNLVVLRRVLKKDEGTLDINKAVNQQMNSEVSKSPKKKRRRT
jgi:regulator of ribosome biosynthesis